MHTLQARHSGNTLKLDGRIRGEPARNKLKTYLKGIGIEPDRDLLWHAFRRFFVKRCMEKGVPLNVLMSWTGHDTVTMALHYSEGISREESSREIMRLSRKNSPAQ